jgi:predicted permease
MQQLLAEGLLLAFGGMLAGLVLAHFGLRTALALIPQSTPLPRNEPVTLDSHVLAFALLTSLATAIFFCLVPSLRLSRVHLSATLRLASHQNAGSGSRKTRQLLAACELALAVLLCIGAGLMLRSFQRLLSVNPGFNTEHVVTMRIFTSPAKYHDPAKRTQYMEQMLREVRAVPGVEAAGTIHLLPLRELTSRSCFAPGELKTEPNPATSSDAQFLIISPGYFDAMQTTILKGRDFNDSDRIGSRGVIIVNQAFVRSFLPGQDPIGHHFSVCWNTPNPAEIVGVVADARQTKLNKAPEPTIFLPNAQAAMYFASIVARATGDPRQIMNSVVAAVHRIDPEQPVTGMETLETVLSESISQPRFQLVLLGAFGLLALALATIGVYGVISYSVTQRVEEIGIRLALGAQRSTVLNLVLREALALAGLGLAAGLLAALGFTRVISALLYDVSPTDPTTLLVVSSTLLLAALLAAFVPALRATRVDPIHALRSE